MQIYTSSIPSIGIINHLSLIDDICFPYAKQYACWNIKFYTVKNSERCQAEQVLAERQHKQCHPHINLQAIT
jgi:hypothetical protein